MKDPNEKPPDSSTPFDQFTNFVRKLVSVPKKEVDAEEKKYQRRRKAATKRKAAGESK
jgi:hypothetical protein